MRMVLILLIRFFCGVNMVDTLYISGKNYVFDTTNNTLYSPDEVSTLPASNLTNKHLFKKWRTTGTGRDKTYLNLTFTEPKSVGCVALLDHNLSQDATVIITRDLDTDLLLVGDFAGGLTDWEEDPANLIGGTWSVGSGNFDTTSYASGGYLRTVNNMNISGGKLYLVKLTVSSRTAGGMDIFVKDGSGTDHNMNGVATQVSANGDYIWNLDLRSVSVSETFKFYLGPVASQMIIDNILIYESVTEEVEAYPRLIPFGSMPWGATRWGGYLLDSESKNYKTHTVKVFDDFQRCQSVSIQILDDSTAGTGSDYPGEGGGSGNSDGYIEVGGLIVSTGFYPRLSYRRGETTIDQAIKKTETDAGYFFTNSPAKYKTGEYALTYLSKKEALAVQLMLEDVGQSEPVLIVPTPDDTDKTAKNTIYGLLQGGTSISHDAFDLYSVKFKIRELL